MTSPITLDYVNVKDIIAKSDWIIIGLRNWTKADKSGEK